MGPRRRLPWALAEGGPPHVGPHSSSLAQAGVFRWFFHLTISQFDLPCPCFLWIQPAQGILDKTFVMDGGSMRPSKKELDIPVASWLPVVEGETLAVGVSTRAISVLVGGSMISHKKNLVNTVATWKGEGGLSTVWETPEMIC